MSESTYDIASAWLSAEAWRDYEFSVLPAVRVSRCDVRSQLPRVTFGWGYWAVSIIVGFSFWGRP